MRDGILATIGNTPLVRLRRLLPREGLRVFAKMEAFNPGGSIKDRPALEILQRAMAQGLIDRDTVVIESSSGNMGIGLAQACAYHELRFICVVDAKTTSQNVRILEAYGAEVEVVTSPDPVTGEYLQARLDRVERRRREIPNSFWADQYANLDNARAHERTMGEIVDELGQVDYLFCPTSTCGTIRGCSEFIKQHGLRIRLVAVDAVGSVIFGQTATKRLIPGHGASVRPKMFRPDMADTCIHVTDLDCIVGCRRLLRTEAILAGGSSGAVVAAMTRMLQDVRDDAVCVAIFPDRGERYLETVFSDRWVQDHFGRIELSWDAPACVKATF
jgi:2,3-diaminopropionate biosynthesis protein SbnA